MFFKEKKGKQMEYRYWLILDMILHWPHEVILAQDVILSWLWYWYSNWRLDTLLMGTDTIPRRVGNNWFQEIFYLWQVYGQLCKNYFNTGLQRIPSLRLPTYDTRMYLSFSLLKQGSFMQIFIHFFPFSNIFL